MRRGLEKGKKGHPTHLSHSLGSKWTDSLSSDALLPEGDASGLVESSEGESNDRERENQTDGTSDRTSLGGGEGRGGDGR